MTEVQKSANCDLCRYFNQFIVSCRAAIYSQHFYTSSSFNATILFYSFSKNEIIIAGGFPETSVEKYNIITGDCADPRATSNTLQLT